MNFFAEGSKAGLQSPAELHKNECEAVAKMIEGKTHLSFNLLTKINEIRYPRDDKYSKPQGRYAVGRYYESMLTGDKFEGDIPAKADQVMVAQMVENALQNNSLEAWLLSPCAIRQKHVQGVMNGFRVHGYMDFYSDCGIIMGAENKTTKERTLNGFIKSCETWYYFAQMHIYKVCGNLETFEYFVSSKINKKLFHFLPEPQHFERGKTLFEKLLENLAYYNVEAHFKA